MYANTKLFNSDLTVIFLVGAAIDFKVINVEVDGPCHDFKTKKIFCERRDRYLQSCGIQVVRWNTRTLSRLSDDDVVEMFLKLTKEGRK